MSSCPCASANQMFAVTNTGLVSDTFKFLSDSNWVTFAGCEVGTVANNEVVLAAGETTTCSVFVTPACGANFGDSTLTISAKSLSTSAIVSRQLGFSVLACNAVEIGANDAGACKNEKITIPVAVKNIGRYTETFALSASVAGKFDSKEFVLAPGESKISNFEIAAATQKINFVVKSKDSGATASKEISISSEDCYSFSSSIVPAEDLVCLRKPAKFELKIRNTGARGDVYQIKADANISDNQILLDAGAEKTVILEAYPKAVGKFNFVANVTSVAKDVTQQAKSTIDTKECGAVTMFADADSKSSCGNEKTTFQITIKNIGAVTELYEIKSSIGTLDVVKVLLDSGESRTVNLDVMVGAQPKNYAIAVNVTAGSLTEKINLNLGVEPCYKSELSIIPNAISICPGKVAAYNAVIANKGKYADIFNITSSNKIIANSVSLQPGENRTFPFTIEYSDAPGVYRIDVNATSQNSKSSAQAGLVLKDLGACYGSTLTAAVTSKMILPSNSTLYEISVKNTGIETMTYSVNVSGPSWIKPGVESLELKSNETAKLYLYALPPAGTELKKYTSTVTVTSAKGASSSIQVSTEVVSKTAGATTTTTLKNATTTTLVNIPTSSRTMLVIGIILAIAVILLLRYVILKK
ncbi:MAG: hypothetical protein V1731_01735 [Candidatus Aenigmatarchaeota archaeon]